jgi:hypothetical protein
MEEKTRQDVLQKIQSLTTTIDSLMEVLKNPNYRKHGFSAELRDNGTIILKAGSITEHHTHSLSKDDSDRIHNIIRMSAMEEKNKLARQL